MLMGNLFITSINFLNCSSYCLFFTLWGKGILTLGDVSISLSSTFFSGTRFSLVKTSFVASEVDPPFCFIFSLAFLLLVIIALTCFFFGLILVWEGSVLGAVCDKRECIEESWVSTSFMCRSFWEMYCISTSCIVGLLFSYLGLWFCMWEGLYKFWFCPCL